jgi:hypothetical protein
MNTHELKTDAEMWRAVWCGTKTAEFRRDDRGFEVWDEIVLRVPTEQSTITKRITHIVRGPQFGIPDGYAMLSFCDAAEQCRRLSQDPRMTAPIRIRTKSGKEIDLGALRRFAPTPAWTAILDALEAALNVPPGAEIVWAAELRRAESSKIEYTKHADIEAIEKNGAFIGPALTMAQDEDENK